MSRREFSRSTKVARFKHANGRCEECGIKLQPGRIHYDHHDPDGMTGDNSFENCRVLCGGPGSCHEAKTKVDVARIAKAKRNEARFIGADAPARPFPKGRGFPKRKKTGRIQLDNTLPPPPLMRGNQQEERK